jgi:hypothetical protein
VPAQEALLGPVGASAREVGEEVRRVGFHAGRAVGDELCAGCHPDVAAQWRQSAHRFSSFNNPYYRFASDALRSEKGGEAARFCAGCHEPALAAAGVQPRDFDRAQPAAQAGITCLACHAMEAADVRDRSGDYVARPDPGFLIPQPFHREQLRRRLLGSPQLCGACHDVTIPAAVTGAAAVSSQDDLRSWQASSFAGAGSAILRSPTTLRCQDCHMPLEDAGQDLAAREGRVRSHRFLTANAALPHLRGDAGAEAAVRRFLREAINVDLAPIDERHVDVVLVNRRVGHRFPGGTMDSNQVWLEVTGFDGRGRAIFASGRAGSREDLPAGTHLVRAQLVDGEGRPIARRDVHRGRGVVFDQALAPGEPRIVRFALPPRVTRLEARLLYRKFAPGYARAACAPLPDEATRTRCVDIPVVEVATGALVLGQASRAAFRRDARRQLEWALGALNEAATGHERGVTGAAGASPEEQLVAAARGALEAASRLDPGRPEPWLGLGRSARTLGRAGDVDVRAYVARATELVPDHPAAVALLAPPRRAVATAGPEPAWRAAWRERAGAAAEEATFHVHELRPISDPLVSVRGISAPGAGAGRSAGEGGKATRRALRSDPGAKDY